MFHALRRAGDVLVNVLLGIGVAAFLALSMAPRVAHVELRAVLTGSMVPVLRPGDLTLGIPVRDFTALKVGDIILFHEPDAPDRVIVHRIHHIETGAGGSVLAIETKGDANNAPDPWRVQPSQILAKVDAHVPLAGYLAEAVRTAVGMIGLLVVPAALLIFQEARVWYGFIVNGTVEDGRRGRRRVWYYH